MANRLLTVLPRIVDREQTAFVSGRNIGENVLCLQLLPAALCAEQRSAYIAFCDFIKAYDTIDRGFLFAVMRRLGVGGQFLSIVRLLLTRTSSRARVNGALSASYLSHAGVRQGCPLATLLYLFVGQALQRWLRHQGLGVRLPHDGRTLTALQFADDTEALLDSAEQVDQFVTAMGIFGAASGQRLHMLKTRLLHVGAPPPIPLPASIAGIPVAGEAAALGLTFRAGTNPPTADWDRRLDGMRQCFHRARRLGLSAMGRGLASASYGVSKLLYHAEFLEVPSIVYEAIRKEVRALILDGGCRRADTGGRGVRLIGVPDALLPGSPAGGGWGALAWREHVAARHVRWAGRLVAPGRGPLDTAPWVHVAKGMLAGTCPGATPTAVWDLPPPLRRMWCAVLALPPPTCRAAVGEERASIARAAAAAPLPWLAGEAWSPANTPGGLLSSVRTVGALARLRAGLAQQPRAVAYTEHVARAVAALPSGWLEAADEGLSLTGGARPRVAVVPALEHAAVWEGPSGSILRLAGLTVKLATWLQRAPAEAMRRERLARFAAAAADGAAADEVLTLLSRAWHLPWDNQSKEILWVLAYDALGTPERLRRENQHCVCGVAMPGRAHYFWACPVAVSLVAEIQRRLPPAAGRLERSHLWLARTPPGLEPDPWLVVCVAALRALERARAIAVRNARTSSNAGDCSPATLASGARLRFLASLHHFCALALAPQDWCREPNPFFEWATDLGRWRPRQ